jgi:hypothetical protein
VHAPIAVQISVQAVGAPPRVANKAKHKVVLPHLLDICRHEVCGIPVKMKDHAGAGIVAFCVGVGAFTHHVDDAGACSLGAANVDVFVPVATSNKNIAGQPPQTSFTAAGMPGWQWVL